MSKITMTITIFGVNIMPGMEELGEELFSERKTFVLMVGKQFSCLYLECISLIVSK